MLKHVGMVVCSYGNCTFAVVVKIDDVDHSMETECSLW